ncbi:MAG: GatB/YqeY domain-containing protein [Planctomycetes bacterium]|nr:GatB/YqeY domain-containing protein [Planctomycetota bacterium]MBI3848231.1 GatB/YqeY domain-containing protein [Planctomycetota bacterium]
MIERLQADLKLALKAGDSVTAGVLRMILSDLKYVEMKKGAAPEEADVVATLQRGVKTRRESIEQFAKGGREDLASKERAEVAVLQRYLPAEMPPAELEAKIAAIVKEIGATSKKDMGRVMKEASARLKGQADGKSIQAVVQKLLP